MARTNYNGGHREHICTECDSPDGLVNSADSDEISCLNCGGTGSREMDRHCLEEWDERFHGIIGLRVVEGDDEEVITTAVEFTGYNDVGIPTEVNKVSA